MTKRNSEAKLTIDDGREKKKRNIEFQPSERRERKDSGIQSEDPESVDNCKIVSMPNDEQSKQKRKYHQFFGLK